MTRRVDWSDDALADLLDQIGFIAQDDPDAADRVAMRLGQTAAALGTFATGHPGRVPNTFEKAVPRLPYIIAYALAEDAITILRVIHTARKWQVDAWPG